MKKKRNIKVYIETSVISYFTSRPSNNLFVLAKQHMTTMWWEKVLPLVNPYISVYVLEEILRGDANAAEQRKVASDRFEILEKRTDIEDLAKSYLKKTALPDAAKFDAYHIATATVYELDYLLTWNCTHIANAFIRKKIESINAEFGFQTPVICTPEELMEI